jgi:hypothetical protein
MIWITEATHAGGYRLRLQFSDGLAAEVDLRDTLFGDEREVFRQARDPEAFQRFRVDCDTVVWEHGLDLAPEYLYERARTGAARRP